MSDGNWRYVLAGVCLGLVALSGQAQESQDQSETAPTEQEGAPQQLPVPLPVVVIEAEEAAISRQRAEQETAEREQMDLVAQQGMNSATQWMAKYALFQTLLILVGTAALIWTLCLTRQANRAAQAAVDVTRETGEAQVRAYLTCIGGDFSVAGDTLTVRPIFKNLGQSPARDVIVHLELESVIPEGMDGIDENMHRIWFRETKKRPGQIDDIAPSEAENGRFKFELASENLIDFDMVWAPLRGGLVTLIATGRVTWKDVFDKPNSQPFWLIFAPSDESFNPFEGVLSRNQ